MGNIFHIDKYGVPAVCNSHNICLYKDEKHFASYEGAKEEIEIIKEEYESKIPKDNKSYKYIKSYFDSLSSIYEFPINKKTAEFEDFELAIVTWLSFKRIEAGARSNILGSTLFSHGDIVRVIDNELNVSMNKQVNFKAYSESVPKEYWDEFMYKQISAYENTFSLERELGIESLKIFPLPLYARKLMKIDGLISTPENINEVVYKMNTKDSSFGEYFIYNHSTKDKSDFFDIYQIIGVVEKVNVFNLIYIGEEELFKEIWNKGNHPEESYQKAWNIFKRKHVFKGLSGPSLLRGFVRMSPQVAKEISSFFKTYREIMGIVNNILIRDKLDKVNNYMNLKPNSFGVFENKEDDGEWYFE